MSSSPIGSVIAAAASSVGKTFLIGVTGALSTRFPRSNPITPPELVSPLSRLTFNILILPMIYVGVGSSIKLEDLGILYPIALASFVIIGISYFTTVSLGYLLRLQNERFFTPLCIACAFPNIVALPIIIFPTLCEYQVMQDIVQDQLAGQVNSISDLDTSEYNLKEQCVLMTDAIIFTYFFGFSIIFWSVGHRSLIHYKSEPINEHAIPVEGVSYSNQAWKKLLFFTNKIRKAIWDILKSPGFVLLILGFATACIPPLQSALFEDAGSLRIFGSTLDSLANAGGTFATLVVAASLIPKAKDGDNEDDKIQESFDEGAHHQSQHQHQHQHPIQQEHDDAVVDDDNDDDDDESSSVNVRVQEPVQDEEIASLPLQENKVPRRDIPRSSVLGRLYRYSIVNLAHSIQIVDRVSIKVHVWQCISRLVLTPAIVFMILLKLQCSGAISSINAISKVVLLINSSCPSALVVVVILKAQGHTDAATAVSKTYLPLYSLSVFTMALWASLGLVAFQSESSFCKSGF